MCDIPYHNHTNHVCLCDQGYDITSLTSAVLAAFPNIISNVQQGTWTYNIFSLHEKGNIMQHGYWPTKRTLARFNVLDPSFLSLTPDEAVEVIRGWINFIDASQLPKETT